MTLAAAVAVLTVAGTLGPGALAGTASTAGAGTAAGDAKPIKGVPGGPAARPEPHAIVEVIVDNRAELDRLVGTGVDLTEHIDAEGGSTVTQAVVTPTEEADLRADGFEIGRTVQRGVIIIAAVALASFRLRGT